MTRRLTATAGIALTLLALAACRVSPNVAAYVGDTTLTEQQVTEIVDDATTRRNDAVKAAEAAVQKAVEQGDKQAQQTAEGAKEVANGLVLPTRAAVVQNFVLQQLCGGLRERQGFQDKAVTKEQVVQQFGMPADSQYADQVTSMLACLAGVPATTAQPTEADLREVYDNGVKAGAIDPSQPEQTFESLSSQFATDEQLATALGNRAVIAQELARQDVSVNPAYRELRYPILSFQQGPAIEIVLGEPVNVIADNS